MDQDFRDAVVSIIDQYMRDNIHTSAPAKVGNVSENFTAELTPDLKVTTDDDREVPYPKISGTAIRPTTISDYYNEIAERMNLNHLDLICEALDCSPTEILVREPNPEPRVRNRTGFEKPVTGQRKDGE